MEEGQLTNAEALISAAIPTSKARHHILASRALFRAQFGRDTALIDAKEVQDSPLSHRCMLTPFYT